MTDDNKTATNPGEQITQEQFQAVQDEIERLRKHNETLLAEKKAETENAVLSKLKKTNRRKNWHAKKVILRLWKHSTKTKLQGLKNSLPTKSLKETLI